MTKQKLVEEAGVPLWAESVSVNYLGELLLQAYERGRNSSRLLPPIQVTIHPTPIVIEINSHVSVNVRPGTCIHDVVIESSVHI